MNEDDKKKNQQRLLLDVKASPEARQLTLPKLSFEAERAIQVIAARAVYECNLPFTIFEKEPLLKLHHCLNPAYRPPTASQLANSLLDEVYSSIKAEVDTLIDAEEALGVTFDETSNVNSERILNITISTRQGIFYYLNLVLPPETMSSQVTTEIVYKALLSISKNRISRINAISTDTCPTMQSIWRLLPQQPGLEHCLMIPCDSHGLQLLIMDIITTPPFAALKDSANQLVGHLKHSPKRLAILRDLQQREYAKPQALAMANATRWGTHFKEFQSILKNKQALRKWSIDQRVDFTTSATSRAVAQSILDPLFFAGLEELADLLTPLHDAQIESEADTSHLGLIRTRWLSIQQHLKNCSAISMTSFEPILEKFDKRYKRQVVDIHHLAFWLCPANIPITRFQNDEMTKILATLRGFISPLEWPAIQISFLHYYNQQGIFVGTNESWLHKDDTELFWLLYYDTAKPLAELATRLIKTTANSVPSERAFSSMKAIHSTTRNRLTAERVNKLLFININTKVLNRARRITNIKKDGDMADESEDDAQEVGLQYTMAPIHAYEASSSDLAANRALNAWPDPRAVESMQGSSTPRDSRWA